MKFKVIIAFVNEAHQDEVINEAKRAGATGVTMLHARGEGIHEKKSFFGLQMDSPRDVLLFIVEDFHADLIMDAIYKAGCFKKKGHGIAFAWTVDRVVGLESQMDILEKEAEENYL